ncbi:hypothetical protein FSP39_005848 [Pinctada imbricata]|uniref:Uncharacterized protein n=1 Tax=Pinctada imbricata TaxID=66713 RepID=A0AA88Y892_PINIB|nr:hypothetical protein FSP39_005848 [Pinctada imbricata]
MAVPIGPPQHGHSQYLMQNQHNVSYRQSDDVTIDTVKTANQMPSMKEQMLPTQESSTQYAVNKASSYPDPGFSPPTKQSSRQPMWDELHAEHDHTCNDDVLQEAVRLDADYRSISQRLEQHESRQGELQHYIQMLLNKPPGDNEQRPEDEMNGSTNSNDHTEELDLNDTAQAAQLQRELHRIQELRNKQAESQVAEQRDKDMSSSQRSSNSDSSNKVLQPDQLSEITRMLHQYWKHGDTPNATETNPPMDDEQMLQLIRMMQAMQAGNVQRGFPQQGKADGRRMAPVSPRSPKQNKEMAKVKRNLKEQLAVPPQGPARGEKPITKEQCTQQQMKKPERKIAPSAKSAAGKNKSAWK